MNKKARMLAVGGVAVLALAGIVRSDDGDPLDPSNELKVMHPECVFFGADHDKLAATQKSSHNNSQAGGRYAASTLTEAVAAALPSVPPASPHMAAADVAATSTNTIDQFR